MLVEYTEKQKIHSEIFWSQVEKVWPDTVVVNKREIDFGEKIEACVILCPLYSPGSLSQSVLLTPPATIEGSRVANKVDAYKTVIQAVNGYLAALGRQLHLSVVFANKGVLFAGKLDVLQEKALAHHKDVYIDAFYKFGRANKISMEFSDYDDWGVNFPTFVDPNAPIPQELVSLVGTRNLPESKMIAQLNSYLKLPVPIEDTKKNRHVIKGVLNMNGLGYSAAFWLIAGYLTFDDKISDIIGPRGIYMTAERFEALFGVARLTNSLKELTRIQLKA